MPAKKSTEQTPPQIVAYGTNKVTTDQGAISNPNLTYGWYKKVRTMRRDPTINLIRLLVQAPVLASTWSYEETEDAPEGAADFIKSNMNELKFELLRTSLMGCLDFGWQGYEKVLRLGKDGNAYIHKLKPLLQDITEIRIDEDNGSYDGLKQGIIVLETPDTLAVAFDVEGTDWYGYPTMKIVETAYDWWNDANESATRHDTKVAGSHWVVHYPIGESTFNDEVVSNADIAKNILNTLEASGRIMVPQVFQEFIDGQPMDAWKIELIEASSSATFTERLKYLDALKVRAFGFPERAILEGQFGTKAEAGEHGDFAITNLELRHITLVNFYNKYCVNHLLRVNWGEDYEDTVKITPSPLQDDEKEYLKQLYQTMLTNPEGFLQEIDAIDMDALRDRLGIPSTPEEPDDNMLDYLRGNPAPVAPGV